MSALLAQATASFVFQGASVTLSCSSPEELKNALATFGIGAANDAPAAPGNVKPTAAATARAGASAAQTTAASATPAAAPAAKGEAGNASASTATPASAQPAASGSASAGEAGNVGAAAQPAEASAPTASSEKPTASPEATLPADPEEAFKVLKKAFLALSTKENGREKCEGVLKPFAVARLSQTTPAQYPAVLAAIQKAAG